MTFEGRELGLGSLYVFLVIFLSVRLVVFSMPATAGTTLCFLTISCRPHSASCAAMSRNLVRPRLAVCPCLQLRGGCLVRMRHREPCGLGQPHTLPHIAGKWFGLQRPRLVLPEVHMLFSLLGSHRFAIMLTDPPCDALPAHPCPSSHPYHHGRRPVGAHRRQPLAARSWGS